MPCSLDTVCCIIVCLRLYANVSACFYIAAVYLSTAAEYLAQSTLLVETWTTSPSAPSLFLF